MMKAKWIGKRIDPHTVRYSLRAGAKGTGKELGAYALTQRADNSLWGDENGEPERIERAAEARGYKIIRWNEI